MAYELDLIIQSSNVTIAKHGSLSSALDLEHREIVGIELPSAWTASATSITFAGSTDNSTFVPIYGISGELAVASAAASRMFMVDALNLQTRWIKVRSGTAAAGAAQEAARTIKVMTKLRYA